MKTKKSAAPSKRHAAAVAADRAAKEVAATRMRTSRALAKKSQAAAAELAEQGAESVRRAAEQHGLQLREATLAAEEASEKVTSRVQDGAATLMRTGEGVAASLQDVGRLWAELMQDGMRKSVAATQSLMRARSLGEAMQIQSEFLRSSFEHLLETTAEISDLSKQMLSTTTHRMASVAEPSPSVH